MMFLLEIVINFDQQTLVIKKDKILHELYILFPAA